MNAKQIKHYEILSEFFNSDILKQAAVDKYFGALLKLDYAFAEDLWEFMLIRSDADLKNIAVARLYIDRAFELFYAANAPKALKTVVDRAVVQRAVFGFSPSAADGELFNLPVNLLVANKTETVDAILKNVAKNEAMGVSYGEYMIKFLDKFFIEMMKKNAQRKVELNRKQSALLMSLVQKVKGDERAMLVQRVKEVL
ncbi:hypothetical protein [Anaerocaecibacter muris]|uniref:hypothetical protein n=1 Tax=Anaerocaecibacter muris TaxID=2941513 RepID=UPI00204257EA|nr:hypothetical protein [Anaerocaecibacter muris]